jgi:hypothetical protein
MPHLATSTDRRPMLILLSDTDLARSTRQIDEVDAVLGETVDLLPLGALVRLSERSRAA